MNPYAVVLAAALVFGSGWQVRTWYDDSKDAAVLRAEKDTRDKLVELANTVSEKTEVSIKGIRIENRNIYTQAQKEIVRETVYADCRLPAAGVLRANQARRGAAAGEPDDQLPKAAAPVR